MQITCQSMTDHGHVLEAVFTHEDGSDAGVLRFPPDALAVKAGDTMLVVPKDLVLQAETIKVESKAMDLGT